MKKKTEKKRNVIKTVGKGTHYTAEAKNYTYTAIEIHIMSNGIGMHVWPECFIQNDSNSNKKKISCVSML